ncbi:hypothetical protein WP1_234 [Pseudomonas phage WP1]
MPKTIPQLRYSTDEKEESCESHSTVPSDPKSFMKTWMFGSGS